MIAETEIRRANFQNKIKDIARQEVGFELWTSQFAVKYDTTKLFSYTPKQANSAQIDNLYTN